MFETIFYTHSFNRYLIIAMLVVVIANSLVKWMQKKKFDSTDNTLSLILMISTHLQLLLGIYLYTTSPVVNFNKLAMKVPWIRYWTAEHFPMMLLAVVLITLGRILSKKSAQKSFGSNKLYYAHRILFVANAVALGIIAFSLFKMMGVRP